MERERDLLSHGLADRTAELQLSVKKAEVQFLPALDQNGTV